MVSHTDARSVPCALCLVSCDGLYSDAGDVESHLVQIRTAGLSKLGHGVLTFAWLQVSAIHSQYTKKIHLFGFCHKHAQPQILWTLCSLRTPAHGPKVTHRAQNLLPVPRSHDHWDRFKIGWNMAEATLHKISKIDDYFLKRPSNNRGTHVSV